MIAQALVVRLQARPGDLVPRHARRRDLQQQVVGDASEGEGRLATAFRDDSPTPGTGRLPSALPAAMVRARVTRQLFGHAPCGGEGATAHRLH